MVCWASVMASFLPSSGVAVISEFPGTKTRASLGRGVHFCSDIFGAARHNILNPNKVIIFFIGNPYKL